MNKLRKAFTISVMAVTVLSMSVIVVPDVGAAASAGDLIKMDGLSSVYYLGANNKRYVFPNESTYFSWYSDFSSVVTIPQSELETYSLGANVVVRPGTKLVKITTDPKVYAVTDNGVLSWVPDEATASALYGVNWAARIIDVSDAFFTNYTISATNVSSAAYPQGSLIQLPGSANVYYINADGNAQKISNEAAMTANRFKYSDVITTGASYTLPTLGTEIAAADTSITDTSQGGGGSPGIDPLAGTGLTVALASDTPAAASIIADSDANQYPQALVPFTKLNFTASSDGDIKVTSLAFTRQGIASDSDIGNLYLYDGNGIMTKLADYNSFNSKVATFSNSAGLFTVPAGTTKSIMLRGDLARGSASVTSGKTIGFDLTAASSVATNGASVSGSFPMAGNLMSTASVSDLGHLYFASYTTYPSSVKADEANVSLWTMNVTADSQNMELRYLKFTMVGTIANTDIQNIRLELQGTQVGAAADIGSDNTVVFDMTGSPIIITSGQTKQLGLRGDMQGGSGRVFKFTVQKSANVVLYDSNYGVYVTPNITDSSTAFSVIQPTALNGTSVSAGTLTLGVATDSPTGNIPDGATGITLAKFSLYAAGEDVKVESLSASSTATGNDQALVNVKLLLDGSQVGSTYTSLTCNGSASAAFTFGNTFVIPAGTTKYLTVVADTTNTLFEAADTVTVALETGSGNAVGQVTLTSISTTAQNGRTLTLASGTGTAAENTSFADRNSANPSGTVSASDTQIASFIITAGSGEAIDVSQIVLQDFSTVTQMGDNFQNLKIKNSSGVQIGSTVASLDSTGTQATYTFSPASPIRISAGQQYIVNIFADIKSSVADSASNLNSVINFYSFTATGVTTGTSASDTTPEGLQQAYISAQGNLTITRDTSSALAQQLILGTTDVELVKFKFQADAAEAINISKIVLSDLINTGTGTIKNVKIYDGDTQVGQSIDLSTTYASTTYGSFAGINLVIPKNGSKIITVKGDVATYDNEAANSPSGSTHEVSIYNTYNAAANEPITAVGASSGQSITGTYLDIGAAADYQVRGNQMTAYKTKITIAWAADTPEGSHTGSANQLVAKINITNSSNVGNYSASIKTMNFAIGRVGASLTTTRSLNVYKNSAIVANLLANTSWLGSDTEQFGNTNITTFVDTEIAAGGTTLFIVTMDTQDAGLTSGTTDKISISVASDDVDWTDGTVGEAGSTTSITSVNTLPLSTKTLSY